MQEKEGIPPWRMGVEKGAAAAGEAGPSEGNAAVARGGFTGLVTRPMGSAHSAHSALVSEQTGLSVRLGALVPEQTGLSVRLVALGVSLLLVI